MNQFDSAIRQQQEVLLKSIDSVLLECTDEIARVMLNDVVRQWPGKDRSVHIYATNRSKQAWYVTDRERHADSVTRRVYNDAKDRKGRDYSQYTDEGYTRQGIHTARSFRVRRVEDSYLERSWRNVKDRCETLVAGRLKRIK